MTKKAQKAQKRLENSRKGLMDACRSAKEEAEENELYIFARIFMFAVSVYIICL